MSLVLLHITAGKGISCQKENRGEGMLQAKVLDAPNTASRDVGHTLKCDPSGYKNSATPITLNKENPEWTSTRKSDRISGIENVKERSSRATNGNWKSQKRESNAPREMTGNCRSGNREETSQRKEPELEK